MICSRVVREVIEEMGGTAVRSRVGHSFIKQLMAETGAVFGGEHSGHYYFKDNFRADSGILAALYVLETMSTEGKPLSELLAPLKRYAASGEINVRVGDPLGGDRAHRATIHGRRHRPPRWPYRVVRRVVVQSAAVQHGAAAATER